MALTDNLIAYWGFDQENANSSVGNPSYVLANGENITYSTGKIAKGINLPPDSRVRITENLWDMVSSPTNFSVAFWVKKNSISTSPQAAVIAGSIFGPMAFHFAFSNQNGSNLDQSLSYAQTTGSSNYRYISISHSVILNQWIHLVGTYDVGSNTMKFYFNGNLMGTETNVTPPTNVPHYSWNGFAINGSTIGTTDSEYGGNNSYDMVGLWTRVISDNEVSELYNGGTGKDLFGGSFLLDGSTLQTRISAFGDVTQSTSIKKYGNGSAYFDGNGDYLQIAGDSTFDFYNTDYTVEMWVFSAASQSGGALITTRLDAIYSPWELQITSSNKIGLLIQSGSSSWHTPLGSAPIISNTTIPQNQWTHIAWARSGTNTTVYINGVADSGLTNLNIPILQAYSLPSNIYIGRGGDGSFNGYLDDLRITKGVARYTSNFTPPLSGLINPSFSLDNNTVLLMHMDGVNNSIVFRDSSPKQFTIGAYGNGTLTRTNIKRFGTASGFFGSGSTSGDYLSISDNNVDLVDCFSTNYTAECWVYLQQYPLNTINGINSGMIGNSDPNSDTEYWTFGPVNDGRVVFYYWTGSQNRIITTTTLNLQEWYHLAFVKNGTNFKIYINGIESASETLNSTPQFSTSVAFNIGRNSNGQFKGYIDELRISKGVARYTSNFVPQTAPFANPTPIE